MIGCDNMNETTSPILRRNMAKAKKTEKIKGYRITVKGQYYAVEPNSGLKTLKFFEKESFDFPEIVEYKDGMKKEEREVGNGQTLKVSVPDIKKAHINRVALHVIRNYYIAERLREKHADFNGVREVKIFSKEPVEIDISDSSRLAPKNIHNMAESELLQFIAVHDLNVSLNSYHDLGDKKLAVTESYEEKVKSDIAAGKSAALSADEIALTDPNSSEGLENSEAISDLLS